MTTDETALCRRVAEGLGWEVEDLGGVPFVREPFLECRPSGNFAFAVLEELARRTVDESGALVPVRREEFDHCTSAIRFAGDDLSPMTVLRAADAALGNGGGE